MGALSDMGALSPRNILFISFLGSALSYSLIVLGDFRALLFSRVLVGLVKQTMTISTSILTTFTDKHNRAQYMGRCAHVPISYFCIFLYYTSILLKINVLIFFI